MANQRLKTMYDEYKLQLDKNKLSAQNELNKANQKANNYMQNYLKSMGIQDSGLGQSAYTNLANNYSNQMVGINQDYSNKLTDYRNTYNQQAKNEAQTLMQGMDNTQLDNYANSLAGDNGLDSSTTNYIQNLANLYKNQNIANEQNSYEQSAISRLENYLSPNANTTRLEQEQFVEKMLADDKLSQNTKDAISEYANAYGKSWKTDRDNFTNEIYNMMENAKTEEEANDYKELYSQISNAQSQEDYNSIVNEWTEKTQLRQELDEELKVSNSPKVIDNRIAKVTDFGKFRDSGSGKGSQDKYVNAILKGARDGKIPNGTVIDFNYGGGNQTYYMYENGKWTRVANPHLLDKNQKYDNKNIKYLGIGW